MLYSDRVQPAAQVYDALGDLIFDDMAAGDGVCWWSDIELPRNLLIADYLAGLTDRKSTRLNSSHWE